MSSPSKPRPRVYYLSPHADDVAFSCAGSLCADRLEGLDVTVITVFLSGEQAAARRAEDEQAYQILDCQYQTLDLFDAPDRPETDGPLGIFAAYGPEHLGITSEVVARLRWYVKPPAAIIAPLAVGGHIDHRIVHEAARALAFAQKHTLTYFEDLPYALAAGSVSRRLHALEAQFVETPGQDARLTEAVRQRKSRSVEVSSLRDLWRKFPLMRRWPPLLRFVACHVLAQKMCAVDETGQRPGPVPCLVPKLHTVSATDQRRLLAIQAYASQWPLFARSPQSLLAAFLDYGRTLGPRISDDKSYDRLWLDTAFGGDVGTLYDGACGT
ncbi:MAG TPA: PIG-L family deacetylase [Pseudomonadota bacterium]|nr:PIG-L family deacetylase [Pseudomonadota bacterium]